MIYFCCESERRALILEPGQTLNGIDWLEVVSEGLPASQQQRRLRIHFIKPAAGGLLAALSVNPPQLVVRISGGERVRGIKVDSANFKVAAPDMLEIEVTPRGDFSPYTLALLNPDGKTPLDGLDDRLSMIDFSFKVECPSDLDCRDTHECPPVVREEPELDYLAKDFNSFRQLVLDRLSLITPAWTERNLADTGITLVELMAYVGDYLSYRQDAISTEAYLGTARQRISLRRHARLLDYRMHEGCNARAWVQVRIKPGSLPASGVMLPRNRLLNTPGPLKEEERQLDIEQPRSDTCFSTRTGDGPLLPSETAELKRTLDRVRPEVFEPMHDAFLHEDHNEFHFYTWAGRNCCLPKGATKATLAGHHPNLKRGLVLVFTEVLGALTGTAADADPAKRHAVRLTNVICPKTDLLTGAEVTEIEWGRADALPFALSVSSVDLTGKHIPDVSVALGNIVLADHGLTLLKTDNLGAVPEPDPFLAPVGQGGADYCERESPRLRPARFNPRLTLPRLTHSDRFAGWQRDALDDLRLIDGSHDPLPASELITQDPRGALPVIQLFGRNNEPWQPRADLIAGESGSMQFVAEIDNEDHARVRFGDDVNGRSPAAGTGFRARYRVGNGRAGNVGQGAIAQIHAPRFLDPVTRQELPQIKFADVVDRVSNPMPARGGVEPEELEEVRQYAPQAFRIPRRCVTPEDYAARASMHEEVQHAAATIRWTGSWHTIFLTIDRLGGGPVDERFEEEIRGWLEPYRLAAHDLEIDGPILVSVEVELFVCVADGYHRSDVKAALLSAFNPVQHADGTRGFFHPDNFTFGDPVRVSDVLSAAQAVPGVRHVEVRMLRRQGSKTSVVPDALTVGRLEIVRMENDRNFPDHGVLRLQMKGGR